MYKLWKSVYLSVSFQDIIVACAVLHNLAILWQDADHFDEEEPLDQDEDRPDLFGAVLPDGDLDGARVRGQVKRNNICQTMPN